MAQMVPLRFGESWVNLTGELANPRYIFVTDKVAKNLLPNLAQCNVDPRDLVIEVKAGTFDVIGAFLQSKARDFEKATAFVLLWVGMDELAFDDSALPSSLPPNIEAYFLPEGPRIFPRLSSQEVVVKYGELVASIRTIFPNASVFSSDPAPRRSSGFAICRATQVSKEMQQQGDFHHHLSLIHKFHGRRCGKQVDMPGGKFPLYDHFFADGVFPKVETWSVVFERVYAAIAVVGNFASAAELEKLKSVKIKF